MARSAAIPWRGWLTMGLAFRPSQPIPRTEAVQKLHAEVRGLLSPRGSRDAAWRCFDAHSPDPFGPTRARTKHP